MEMFGILCSCPGAFLASIMYLYVAREVLTRKIMQRVIHKTSLVVLGATAAEWLALVILGPVRIRSIVGPAYYPTHLVLFFLGLPALANVLLIKRDGSLTESWVPIAVFCAVLAIPLVLTQYFVAEALYGINGDTGPFRGL